MSTAIHELPHSGGSAKKLEISEPNAKRNELLAKFSIDPTANAGAVIQLYAMPFAGEQDIVPVAHALRDSIDRVQKNDMAGAEAMLMAQAEALQTIFANFSRRALAQDYQQNLESFFRMAMKAQNQCRMTLETLANIKNPPVVFAKQANIAHGHQQVNNGTPAPSPAQEKTIQSNELLEAQPHGERLDIGTPGTAARTDTEMEAVGAIHRAPNAGGKSHGC